MSTFAYSQQEDSVSSTNVLSSNQVSVALLTRSSEQLTIKRVALWFRLNIGKQQELESEKLASSSSIHQPST